jgi:hypothetical protein
MALNKIYDAIDQYKQACVLLALNDYSLQITLDDQIKKSIKLEERVRTEHNKMCRALSKLNDQARKIRRADQRKGPTRRT